MRERIISFGGDNHLQGFVNNTSVDANGFSAVFVNAGIVHRIGPHRLYIKLSRALSKMGAATLRFDLSGMGDSAAATSPKSHGQQCIDDVISAVDWMTAKGLAANGVTLIGLCSGSEHAYKAAVADPRVTRLVLLEPHSYSTPIARMERAASKVADPKRWGRALGRAAGFGNAQNPTLSDEDEDFAAVIDQPDPPREQWANDLSILLSRGVKIYIRYTKMVEEDLTRPEHFYAAFKDVPGIEKIIVDVDGDADHTYTALSAQSRLIEAVTSWLCEEQE